MSTIHDTNDLVDSTARPRIGLTALLHGWRDICAALAEAVTDILDPSFHRSGSSALVVPTGAGTAPSRNRPPRRPLSRRSGHMGAS